MDPVQQEKMQTSPSSGLHYGWIIFIVGFLVEGGALGLARFGYSMILPGMLADPHLHLSPAQTGLIASANMIGYTISALVAGFLASRYGPKVIIIIGLVWVALTMAATGLATGASTVALARFLTGLGSAAAHISGMGLLVAWFSTRRRGMATGFFVGGTGLGLFLNGWTVPLINGIYLDVGWRYNWYLLGLIAAAVAILAAVLLRNSPAEKNLLPIGEVPGAQTPAKPANGGKQKSESVSIGNIIKIKGVPMLTIMYFCFGFSYIIVSTYMVTFLVQEAHCSQALAGHIWSIVGLISIISGLIWGMISDRFGRRNILATVFLLQAVCYLLLQARFTDGFLLWLAPMMFGLVAWSIPGMVAATCGDISDPKRAPAVLGFATFIYSIGQVLGPTTAGYIKAATGSFGWAFLLAAGLAVLGAIFASRIMMPRN
ncbi:MAG: MFS transporter [Firmicutes bacterium]|nr:MFS transporter [Bacillota bacterium]